MSLAEIIEHTLLLVDRKWSVGGKKISPTAGDVQRVLDGGAKELYNATDFNQLNVGGLLFVKDGTHLDIYVRVGDYNDPSS